MECCGMVGMVGGVGVVGMVVAKGGWFKNIDKDQKN